MITSMYSFSFTSSNTDSRRVFSTMSTQFSGNPAFFNPSRISLVSRRLECMASEPPLRITPLPDLMVNAATSIQTFGRDSKIIRSPRSYPHLTDFHSIGQDVHVKDLAYRILKVHHIVQNLNQSLYTLIIQSKTIKKCSRKSFVLSVFKVLLVFCLDKFPIPVNLPAIASNARFFRPVFALASSRKLVLPAGFQAEIFIYIMHV